jgi:hypothetical protein
MKAVNDRQANSLLAAAVIEQAFFDLKNWKAHIRNDAEYFFMGEWFELYAAVAGVDPECVKDKVYPKPL